MEKLIYLLGETEAETVPRGRVDLREKLLASVPALVVGGARTLSFSVADVEDPGLDLYLYLDLDLERMRERFRFHTDRFPLRLEH